MDDIRFSTHFKLNKSQWELDFVDIPLNTDLKLFVDPYAISISESEFCAECNDMIITYFRLIVEAIRDKRDVDVKQSFIAKNDLVFLLRIFKVSIWSLIQLLSILKSLTISVK
jgi:hypothetical protein